MHMRQPTTTLFPYTTLFRSGTADARRCSRAPARWSVRDESGRSSASSPQRHAKRDGETGRARTRRSEEHTSELQSPCNLVCRLLLEKKKKKEIDTHTRII